MLPSAKVLFICRDVRIGFSSQQHTMPGIKPHKWTRGVAVVADSGTTSDVEYDSSDTSVYISSDVEEGDSELKQEDVWIARDVRDVFMQFMRITHFWNSLCAERWSGRVFRFDDRRLGRPEGSWTIPCLACPVPGFNTADNLSDSLNRYPVRFAFRGSPGQGTSKSSFVQPSSAPQNIVSKSAYAYYQQQQGRDHAPPAQPSDDNMNLLADVSIGVKVRF
ncbi:hypothetical protein ACEPAG_7492 [Sanghuangporus baumii]